ncbi:hypothetical protein BED46_027970 [Burkholderia contaminans]|jgi:hypothetical protein|nr:hypothetical protein [Burkholderia contaminans]ODN25469.1 hypothetical protein BGI28_19685 [Burkholderia contaminans]OMI75484.1 hypothetical protein BED46_027970 [Burkholderia contaminans]RBQ57722.1 hypothetical protein DI458_35485 [Burkholderia contaminans]
MTLPVIKERYMQIRDSIKAWRRNEDRRERVRGKATIAFAVMAAVVLFAVRNHHPYLIVFGVFCMLATIVWCFSSSSLPDANVAVFDDCLLWIAQDAKVPEFAKALIAIEVNEATQSARPYVFDKLYALDDRLAEQAFIDRVERGEGYRAIMTKRPPVDDESAGVANG